VRATAVRARFHPEARNERMKREWRRCGIIEH